MYEDCRYKIGDFAAMTGMPQSKIRYYEKEGLFSSAREENGYRYFTPDDAFRANAFRVLLQYGFSVEQALEMLDAQQESCEFEASLVAQHDKLIKQSEMLRYRLARIDSALDSIKSEPTQGFSIVDVDDQIFVRASQGRNFNIARNNEIEIAAFFELFSLTSCARIIAAADFDDKTDILGPSYISCMPKHEAYRLPATCNLAHIEYLTMGKCLRLRRRVTRDESVHKSTFDEMFGYLNTHGYRLRDDILLLPTFLNLDGKGSDIETLLVPIG